MSRKANLLGFFLTLLCAFFGAAHAQAFDHLYESSARIALSQPLQWVAVPKGSVASPEVLSADSPTAGSWNFQPYTDDTTLPTSDKQEVWARFALPLTPSLQTWFIRLPGRAIFKVSLYSRDPQGGWKVHSAGQAIAPADWALRTRVPSFELQSRSDLAPIYFLRFEHHKPITERPMLLTPIEYIDGASRVGVVIGLMWGMFSLLAVLCLAAFSMARNKVFLWFGAVVVTLMFTQLVVIGYGGWRIWRHSIYLNQVMGWVSAALTMAAAAWFCAQASYARSAHPRIYQLLAVITVSSLLMACLVAIQPDLVPRNLRNLWLALAILMTMGSLVWMSLRGQAWNLQLLLGAAPIALAMLARLSYNAGWVLNIESAQAAGVLSAMLGLLWVFLVLAWRSRAALFSNHRAAALATYDPASGLMLPRIIEGRLPQMLLRARRQKSECGVLMLRWLNQGPSNDELSDQKRSFALSRIGEILRRAARDMDTAARYDENQFMMLVDGPISRDALSEIATRILADCLRAAQKWGDPSTFNLRIAIWHGTPTTQTAQQVMEALTSRLHSMSSGTRRHVQFVDSALEPEIVVVQDISRREDLMAKINALETSHPALSRQTAASLDR
ncbi:7TM diverse intracellular signaling domain-containing protein [Polaromonas sp. OV174]|uniref:sensor domain-containing diguanylate cyclase n=1 Tax=Polaromonas sp. OV174 TaxID=1855300 RepID=UPI0015A60F92|nr:7TM diverse intracellular signaling domain-containing protein [Polaromonas sp. OV174]